MRYSFESIGTKGVLDTDQDPNFLRKYLHDFEQLYSRFITHNLLSDINSGKKIPLTPELRVMMRVGMALSYMSDGVFDFTVKPVLDSLGYDSSYSGVYRNLTKATGYHHISVDDERIQLRNGVEIELGGVGKGYLIDRLSHYCSFINFGGDIYSHTSTHMYIQHPTFSTIVGEVSIRGAMAVSSPKHRSWKHGHHLINMNKKRPSALQGSVVCADEAIWADGWATTLACCDTVDHAMMLIDKYGLKAALFFEDRARKSPSCPIIFYS